MTVRKRLEHHQSQNPKKEKPLVKKLSYIASHKFLTSRTQNKEEIGASSELRPKK